MCFDVAILFHVCCSLSRDVLQRIVLKYLICLFSIGSVWHHGFSWFLMVSHGFSYQMILYHFEWYMLCALQTSYASTYLYIHMYILVFMHVHVDKILPSRVSFDIVAFMDLHSLELVCGKNVQEHPYISWRISRGFRLRFSHQSNDWLPTKQLPIVGLALR